MSAGIPFRSKYLQGLHLLAAEGQQLAGQIGSAGGRFEDFLHLAVQGMFGTNRVAHQFRLAAD
jgi:hypothetical protein